MYLKKVFIFTIIFTLLFSSTISVTTLNAVPDKYSLIMKKQEQCLKSYSELLQFFKENSNPNVKYDNDYNVDFPDDYGGIYFDNQCGEVTLCLTNLENQDIYVKYFDKALLNIKEVKYSFDELKEAYNYLVKSCYDICISSISLSETFNQVNVSVQNDNEKNELLDLLDSHNIDSNIVYFEENSMPIEREQLELNNTELNLLDNDLLYARAGEKISLTTTGSTYFATISANAYDPITHKYGIITAGHLCSKPNALVYSNVDNQPINLASSAYYEESGTCDAGFIPFYPGYDYVSSTAIRNGNNTSQIVDKISIVSPAMCGIDIVKYGTTTNKTYGTIVSLFSEVTYADDTHLDDVIECNINSSAGDSGGPMGIDTVNGLCLLGILSGGNGSTTYFIKNSNIEQNLEVVILSVQMS